MNFAHGSGGSAAFQHAEPLMNAHFDVLEWHEHFQSCVRYFLDHAQYSSPVQAVAAYVNIQLPFQRAQQPVLSSRSAGSPPGTAGSVHLPGAGLPGSSRKAGNLVLGPPQLPHQQPLVSVTLLPYIRRLVCTGFDMPPVLHGFFGDDYKAGIGRLHDQERRNYLFAAKSDNWLKVKAEYDMDDHQMVPFLKPLTEVREEEIAQAESDWSAWLAMQDWMLGPRAPEVTGGSAHSGHGSIVVKREEE